MTKILIYFAIIGLLAFNVNSFSLEDISITVDQFNTVTISGADTNGHFGSAVKNAGDVNGDGIEDIIIGAPDASPPSRFGGGCTYIVYGVRGGITNLNVSNLTNTQGFKVFGAAANDHLASSVSGAGDINADGIDDIIIGAPGADPKGRTNSGIAYVVYGSRARHSNIDLSLGLNNTLGFSIFGANDNDGFGTSVSHAGDINGDGIADIIVGAPKANKKILYNGAAYVIFGSYKGLSDIDLQSFNQSQGFKVNGSTNGFLGFSVSSAGDVNADGVDDVIIGASNAVPLLRMNAGSSYIIYGNRTGLSNIDLSASALPLSQGFTVMGAKLADYSGFSVSSAGDINGDGIDDIVIGAPNATPFSDRQLGGIAYVIFGKWKGLPNIDLNILTPDQGFKIYGPRQLSNLGASVNSAGDVNGDGINDIIISAPNDSPQTNLNSTGSAYVIYGSRKALPDVDLLNLTSSQGFSVLGTNAGDDLGCSVSTTGDFNGDHRYEILIGASNVSTGLYGAGAAYVISPSKSTFEIDI